MSNDSLPSSAPAIIDTRPLEAYDAERPLGAVHFSLEELVDCAYLLPPRHQPLVIIAATSPRLQETVRHLQKAQRTVRCIPSDSWQNEFDIETGTPSRKQLWQPSRGLAAAFENFCHLLPGDTALDIACGSGRNAVYLSQHGMRVTGIDWQDEALVRAQDLGARSGVELETHHIDLNQGNALEGFQADFIVVARYLNRDLFPTLQKTLSPGGLLYYETFSPKQAELGHPRNPNYILRENELLSSFPRLETLHYEETFCDGAHLSHLVAKRTL